MTQTDTLSMKKICFFILFISVLPYLSFAEVGIPTPTPAPRSDLNTQGVSVPRRYFAENENINGQAYREFLSLYDKFKSNPKLAESQTALQRVLAFYAKNKNGIPRSCGGDLEAAVSPRGEELAPIQGIDNQDYVLLVDYTKPHVSDRFFVLDMKTGEVESCPAAHGYGSDNPCPSGERMNCGARGTKCEVPASTGNNSGSGMTSRGFYLTDSGYRSGQATFNGGTPSASGVNALNLRGLLGNVNDNALARSVVFHRASYASNACSRSAGCPAICPELFEEYKDKVKRSLMYVHTPEDEEKDQPDC